MQDLLTTLDTIKRPSLLIRAARIGIPDYRREVHLPRHLGETILPRSGEALVRLMEIESDLDERRRKQAAGYSPARHVDILIAMICEARILRASHRPKP